MNTDLTASIERVIVAIDAAATTDDMGPLGPVVVELTDRRQAEDPTHVVLIAEALLHEAAAWSLVASTDAHFGKVLGLLTKATATISQHSPGVRVSVLTRALGLASPLLQQADNAAVKAAMTTWAADLPAAIEEQAAHRNDGITRLTVAEHIADRRALLDDSHQALVDAARGEAEAARLALQFAGDDALIERAERVMAALA